MLGVAASLAITLGLLIGGLALLRRLQGGYASGGKAIDLRVLQRVGTGPRQGIALVRCGERVLVVSVAESGSRLLTELEGDDLTRALNAADALPAAPLPRAGRPARRTAPKPAWLERFSAALLIAVLVPGLVMAQQTAGTAGTAGTAAPAAQNPPSPPSAGSRAEQLREALQNAGPRASGAAGPLTAIPTPPAPRIGPPVSAEVTSKRPLPPKPSELRQTQQGIPQVAAPTPPAPPQISFTILDGPNGLKLSGAVGLAVFLGLMTLLPAMFLLMTSFTRILIVLHFLRSAIGTQATPPSQVLVALAVLLTGVVMNPTLEAANRDAIQPYLAGKLEQIEAYKKGLVPFREFMLANTREADLTTLAELSQVRDVKSIDELPTATVVSAFVISELRTAFQMGFVIFLPFLVVDMIVASVLQSMGMFMLPPVMISLPFKLLLFVLADGWSLVVRSLVASFRPA